MNTNSSSTATVRTADQGTPTGLRLSMIRHGQSLSNMTRRIQGTRSCEGLTQLGHEQALCLARRIELDHVDDPITRVYSTPLARAEQTASPVAQVLGLEVEYLDTWRYPDYGSADGRSWRQVYAEFSGVHPALQPHVPVAEGAEPATAFRASVEQAIDEFAAKHPGEHVLAFGSTENIMAANELLFGMGPDARTRAKVAIDHTGITTWDLLPSTWAPTGRRATLVRHNDSGHLPNSQRESRFRAIPVLGA